MVSKNLRAFLEPIHSKLKITPSSLKAGTESKTSLIKRFKRLTKPVTLCHIAVNIATFFKNYVILPLTKKSTFMIINSLRIKLFHNGQKSNNGIYNNSAAEQDKDSVDKDANEHCHNRKTEEKLDSIRNVKN
jgi:hypothetical protein